MFGFDPNMLSGIVKQTEKMTEFERHGGLVFDEMKLEENFLLKAAQAKLTALLTWVLSLLTMKEQLHATTVWRYFSSHSQERGTRFLVYSRPDET